MHGHAHQLIGCFHRNLVVGNKDKLYLIRHLFHHRRITTNIGIIQRCIDFVKHTERRWIKSEYGKYHGNCSECFFTAREQLDRGILFTRRSRHQGDAGIEQVVASEFQVGVATTKEFREQLLNILVH